MNIRSFLEKEILTAGERVLGKMDSCSPVDFYLCKNQRQGDFCTPWCLKIWDGGKFHSCTSARELAEKITADLNKKHRQGSDPRLYFTATDGYINVKLSDEFILETVEMLAQKFCKEDFEELRPDDEKESFLKDYCIYLAKGTDPDVNYSCELSPEIKMAAVLVIYGQMTRRSEQLEHEIYKLCKTGNVNPTILRAAAYVMSE